MIPFAKIGALSKNTEYRVEPWIERQLSQGRYGFTIDELRSALPELGENAIKLSLIRQAHKGKILSVRKGYYIIIPPQYSSQGILPPALFIDGLMKALNRPYYVSLLSASALHGAAHQQPQEYFVATVFPVMRPTLKMGVKINYVSISNIPHELLEKRKTESGNINVSQPSLTMVDLVQFEKRIGGLSRAAELINELSKIVKAEDMNSALLQHAHARDLQRLGYILEFVCRRLNIAQALFNAMNAANFVFLRIPLKPGRPVKGFSSLNRWNVIVNTQIVLEE